MGGDTGAPPGEKKRPSIGTRKSLAVEGETILKATTAPKTRRKGQVLSSRSRRLTGNSHTTRSGQLGIERKRSTHYVP